MKRIGKGEEVLVPPRKEEEKDTVHNKEIFLSLGASDHCSVKFFEDFRTEILVYV